MSPVRFLLRRLPALVLDSTLPHADILGMNSGDTRGVSVWLLAAHLTEEGKPSPCAYSGTRDSLVGGSQPDHLFCVEPACPLPLHAEHADKNLDGRGALPGHGRAIFCRLGSS